MLSSISNALYIKDSARDQCPVNAYPSIKGMYSDGFSISSNRLKALSPISYIFFSFGAVGPDQLFQKNTTSLLYPCHRIGDTIDSADFQYSERSFQGWKKQGLF